MTPDQPLSATDLRRQAEARLRDRPAGTPSSAVDNERLLHELQVHQTELEMQNEELRDARDSLETEAKRYTEFYDFAPLGYLTLGRGGQITQANLAAASLLGTEQAQLTNRGLAIFLVAADRRGFNDDLRQLFAGESGLSCEVTLESNGRPGPVVQINATRADDGRECRLVIADITAQMAAQAALSASEERFRLASLAVKDVMWDWNLADDNLEWNQQFQTSYGYQPDDIEPGIVSWTNRVHADDLERVEASLQQVIASPENTWAEEYRFRRADGSYANILDHGYVVRDPSGQALRMVGSMQDISERRAAEQERDRFFNLSVDLLSVAGFNGYLKQVNPAWERTLGWSAHELLSRPWLEFVHPEDRSKSVAALDTLEGDRQVLGFENRCWHKDGSFRWLSWSAFPLGESDEIFAVARDVTERKSLEEQIIHAQRHEAMGTLAGGLAHDLNNILTPIIMVAGLRLETVTDPDDREMMELVKVSAQRGANIIAQLLTYSRGLQGEYLPVSVQHLIKEITALARETFPRNITVIADVDTDLWTVVSDATQVHQILMNLCVNARDAMPEGGELRIAARNVDITVGDLCLGQGDRLGSYVHLSVSDTGTGIPQEILDQIFDPFFSTKRTGKGSGLGLSSVLGIVRNHGGFIKVDSKPDSGTTFNINLPAERVASVAVQDKPVPAAVGHGETILVVDDEKSVILVARRCLERNGYRVLTAINGQEAIEVFVAHQTAVKLVLTDLMMPMMDGVTLARELHALAPAIRVIATSGLEPVENASIVEFISKPFKPNALLAAVARQLQSPVTCQPSVRLES